MKRIIVLALAACMVLGAAFSASATEISASGYLYAGYDYLQKDNAGKSNDFYQRFRTQVDIVASENVSGVVYFEINNTWGAAGTTPKVGGGSGGQLGADGVNVQTRRAYMTFMVPSTTVQVRAGIQSLALPGAVAGSPILADDVAAVVASTAIANTNVTAFFARPYDTQNSEGVVDFYGAIVAADLGGVSVSPYAMFAATGDSAGELDGRDAQWYGIALEAAPMTNLTLAFDGMYGKLDGVDGGFLVAGKAAYAADFAVPAILAWYGSGNDSDGEGIMPTVDGKDFVPTTFIGWGAAAASADATFGDALGKWGVTLQASDITFIEKVSHTVRASYIRGTNDKAGDLENWSDDDSAFEFDFVTIYAAYDNLDVIVDLAYAATDLDDSAPAVDDVFKAALGVQYNF